MRTLKLLPLALSLLLSLTACGTGKDALGNDILDEDELGDTQCVGGSVDEENDNQSNENQDTSGDAGTSSRTKDCTIVQVEQNSNTGE